MRSPRDGDESVGAAARVERRLAASPWGTRVATEI